jgi:hypothetical protein
VTDKNICDLDLRLQPVAIKGMTMANNMLAPSKAAITVTWRSGADQNRVQAAGLSRATAGNSPHNCCSADGVTPAAKAFDFAVLDENGAYVTDGTDPRYATVASVVLEAGQDMGLPLTWGGNWTPATDGCEPDFDHIEITGWRTA